MNAEQKTASYEQFCDHYNLDPQNEVSKEEYKDYLEKLAFTHEMFSEEQRQGKL